MLKIPSEHEEQVEFVKWFRQNYDGVLIFAVPNGGKRNQREALRLKLEGVTPGVPDLFVLEWGLWIEMKRQKNSNTSQAQKEFMDYAKWCGYDFMICKGAEDAKKQVKEFTQKYGLRG